MTNEIFIEGVDETIFGMAKMRTKNIIGIV